MPSGGRPLRGSLALVTGATSGIGLAVVRQLAALGADIGFVYRAEQSRADVAGLLDRAGVRHIAVRAELSSIASVRRIAPAILAQAAGIDILVNCAGIGEPQEFLEQTVEEWERVQAVNLRAPFLLTQDVARAMIERGRGGRIVNVSSSSAFRAELAPPAYVASKGGLNALTRSAAGALGRYGINVNAVVPGMTSTPMVEAAFGPAGNDEPDSRALTEGPLRNLFGRMSTPEDIAEVVTFLCRPASRQITGQLIHVSAGAIV